MNLRVRVRDIFAPNGALAQALPGFEARESQVSVANLVAGCLEEGTAGIGQAGVGTGKSLGYLLPAALFAVMQNKRGLICTNTKDLQGQLLRNDLPLVQRILRSDGHELLYAGLKGKANYVCKRRLTEAIETTPEVQILQQIRTAIESGEASGDRDAFAFEIPSDVWQRIERDGKGCPMEVFQSSCYYEKSRTETADAHLIVTNHYLFFSDLKKRIDGMPGTLPPYDFVIFDEAHRIDEVYRQTCRETFGYTHLEKLLQPILTRSEPWVNVLKDYGKWDELFEIRKSILDVAHRFFSALYAQLARDKHERVLLEMPVVSRVPFGDQLIDLIAFLKPLRFQLGLDDETSKGVYGFIKRVENLHWLCFRLFGLDGGMWDSWALWLEVDKNGEGDSRKVCFNAVPYQPSVILMALRPEIVQIYLSGTIAPGGDFAYPAKQFGQLLDRTKIIDVASPFDYYEQGMAIAPRIEALDREGDEYFDALAEVLKNIFMITGGSTFVLFTSFEAIRKTKDRLMSWFEAEGLTLFAHLPGVNKDRLLAGFIESDRGILFGAESFWEGINVPGDDLRCVVIEKFPFPNPSDMLTKARSLKIERRGGNSFNELMLPIAKLKMKQGVGRLIRSTKDRGAIVILEQRIHTKKYGSSFLWDLPNFRRAKTIEEISRYF